MNQSKKTENKTSKSDKSFIACNHCALDNICKPIPLCNNQALSQILDNMEQRVSLHQGESLFHQNDTMNSLYAVTSGTIKLLSMTNSKHEQVTGFRFPGELLGDDAIYTRKHNTTAIASIDTSVCIIPINDIDNISKLIPSFQKLLIELIGKQCHLLHTQFSAYISQTTADEKLATFILNMKERTIDDDNIFQIPMNRGDIANYLGLRNETLSRILSKFQKNEIISINGKQLKILDTNALQTISRL